MGQDDCGIRGVQHHLQRWKGEGILEQKNKKKGRRKRTSGNVVVKRRIPTNGQKLFSSKQIGLLLQPAFPTENGKVQRMKRRVLFELHNHRLQCSDPSLQLFHSLIHHHHHYCHHPYLAGSTPSFCHHLNLRFSSFPIVAI